MLLFVLHALGLEDGQVPTFWLLLYMNPLPEPPKYPKHWPLDPLLFGDSGCADIPVQAIVILYQDPTTTYNTTSYWGNLQMATKGNHK